MRQHRISQGYVLPLALNLFFLLFTEMKISVQN